MEENLFLEKKRERQFYSTQPMFYHRYNDLCLNNNPNILSISIDCFFKEFVDFFFQQDVKGRWSILPQVE